MTPEGDDAETIEQPFRLQALMALPNQGENVVSFHREGLGKSRTDHS